MTTIVVMRNAIAADSQTTSGNQVMDNNTRKLWVFQENRIVVGIAGCPMHSSSIAQYMHDYIMDGHVDLTRYNLEGNYEAVALSLESTGNIIYQMASTEESGYQEPDELHGEFYAIGSGAPYALGVLGANSVYTQPFDIMGAVEIASKFDIYTNDNVVLVSCDSENNLDIDGQVHLGY